MGQYANNEVRDYGATTNKKIVSWNCCSLQPAYRTEEISERCQSSAAVLLQGTRRRQWLGEPHHIEQTKFHHVIHFGWARGPGTNASAGCAVLLLKRLFPAQTIKEIKTVPAYIAGRGGLVIVARGPFLLALFSVYFPPRPKKKQATYTWRKSIDMLFKWLAAEIRGLAGRYIPIIGADLNSDIDFLEDHVSAPLGRPTEAGQRMRSWLFDFEFVAATSLGRYGHCNTFYGNKGAVSRIDFIFLPKAAWENLVVRTWLWIREIKALRFSPFVVDHGALVIALPLCSPAVCPKPNLSWDHSALSAASAAGTKREEFLRDLHQTFLDKREALEIMRRDAEPTRHCFAVVELIRSIALPLFGRKKQKRDRDLGKAELFEQRRHLREQLVDPPPGLMRRSRLTAGTLFRRGPLRPLPPAIPLIEQISATIKRLTKTLRSHKETARKERRDQCVTQLAEAWIQQDHATIARVARQLGGTGIAVKNRNFRAVATFLSKAQWAQHLGQPPTQGGMSATVVETPAFVAPPLGALDALLTTTAPQQPELQIGLNDEEVAQRDISNIAERLLLAKNRRFAPRWSLPAEIWRMILAPSRLATPCAAPTAINEDIVPPSRRRDGSKPKCYMTHLDKYIAPRLEIAHLLAHARAAGLPPLQASYSHAFTPTKPGGAPGAKGKRVIHAMCVFWRLWARATLALAPFLPAPFCYGGVPQRRREGLMLTSRVIAWRLHAAKIPALIKSYDAANAFACGTRE